MPRKQLSPAGARRKGLDFERKVVRVFNAAGLVAHRNLEETREGNTGDVIVSPLMLGEDKLPTRLVIQCKAHKSPRPWIALKEAVEAAATLASQDRIDAAHWIPVAVVKKDYDRPWAWVRPQEAYWPAGEHGPILEIYRLDNSVRAYRYRLDYFIEIVSKVMRDHG